MGIVILFLAFIALIGIYVLAIEFPAITSVITSAGDALLFYIGKGLGITFVFLPKTSTILFATLAITIQVIYLGYVFIMWILRKIPVAGIE